MKEFTVIYLEDDAHELPFLFQCRADDADHAAEQCVNAYPDCLIVRIFADTIWTIDHIS